MIKTGADGSLLEFRSRGTFQRKLSKKGIVPLGSVLLSLQHGF